MQSATLILLSLMLSFGYGFGPKKIYSLNLPTNVVSVKVIGRQIFFVGPWYIGVIDNVQWKFRQRGRMSARILNKDIANPRMVGKIPPGTFKGSRDTMFWVTSWGTNDTAGAVYVMKETADYSDWADISIDAGWNYERTQWVDMNRDGLKDCLTARYRGGVGQMLWFKQPPGQTLWGQNIIHEGMADGNFLGFIYDKKSYILVAGNQFNTLGLYWTMNRKNNWSYSRQVRHRVIDNYGKYFDVQYIDLNKDGRADILTTTVQISSSRGQVLSYEIPFDIQNKIWTRRVLAAGFTGDYAPGKATAFWANKWKRKSDRPSIFLSGAGEEKLFILSPTPKTSGWGYYKSSLAAGTGMIGIPYIIDLDGDSYPEIFVPQGNQVHVFSYDYRTSAAAAPSSASAVRRTTTTRAPVRFVNPFFRPTTAPPPPAIPADALPVGPRPNSVGQDTSDPSTAERTSLDSPRVPAPIAQQPSPVRLPTPNRGSSGSDSLPQSGPSLINSQQRLNPFSSGIPQNRPPFQPGPPNRQGSQNPSLPSSNNDPTYQNPLIQPPPANYRVTFPYYFTENNISNPVIPADPSDIQQSNVSNEAIPFNFDFPSSENIIPIDPSSYMLSPANRLISVTEQKFSFYTEALDACLIANKILCSTEQLQTAVSINDPIPEFEWGWMIEEGKAASLKQCTPGEIKWDGYVCHNGVVELLPIRNEAYLQALCCSVVNYATVTRRRFRNKADARNECSIQEKHLCSFDEMLTVWNLSSYKGFQWGWFDYDNTLIRLAHYCDVNVQSWPGYRCIANRLETTTVQSETQQRAFCCPNDARKIHYSFIVIVISVMFAWLIYF
ncbi:uncharacterized protein LOC143446302 isoform X2 [Clavelina lepadiformis]|uniref:uncharacterized protein LOC143446302 isoform X2 n=1 Tax=Clavelina lepadiformis TaxID=159417 RepID=UPI004042251E